MTPGRGRPPFQLFLFSTHADAVRTGVAAGINGVVVDWEQEGKRRRQAGADTEVNTDTPADLRRVREMTAATLVCRVNPFGARTQSEVDEAIACGADEVLLPMVRSQSEVEAALDASAGRCRVGILVETVDAVSCAPELGRLPISRAYVGLNDLAIERESDSIFDALADGTVERIRESFQVPFGFGGLTRPDCGEPVPARLLIAEMARLDCSFSFLRRSYRRDVPPGEQAEAVEAIRSAFDACLSGPSEQLERDHAELGALVTTATGTAASPVDAPLK